jgi:glutamine synthetase
MSTSNPLPIGSKTDLADVAELFERQGIETVILAIPDLEGRLLGKRLTKGHFLDDVALEGAEGCTYLLASDIEMGLYPDNSMVGWSTGFGDMLLRPDLTSTRILPWEPAAALVIADAYEPRSATPISVSPRQILRNQLERLASIGFRANASTELEFIAFRTSYREAWEQRYRDLRPALPYNSDYAIFDGGGIEPLVRRIREEMLEAGMAVEGSKGECNFGQHEVNFRYGEPMCIADQHVVYKGGAKEIARQSEMAITFMAKYDQREGSSCHLHLSLLDPSGANAFAANDDLFHLFIAGQLACMRDFTLLFAPHVNSYKRLVDNSFAPTTVAWGYDNRTCPVRVVGHGPSLRLEHRLAGADVQPHLALAAVIAAGIHGVERELQLEPPVSGNAYMSERLPRVHDSLTGATAAFSNSETARSAFGDEVVDHYVARGKGEVAAAARTVSEWERIRGFERV